MTTSETEAHPLSSSERSASLSAGIAKDIIARGVTAGAILVGLLHIAPESFAYYPPSSAISVTQPERIYAKVHFAVTCPKGEAPALIEVASSGLVPKDSETGAMAAVVIRMACFTGTGESPTAPTITQDTKNNGKCLGYGSVSHLIVQAVDLKTPEFFTTPDGEVAVVGIKPDPSNPEVYKWSEPEVTGVSLHNHNRTPGWIGKPDPAANCAAVLSQIHKAHIASS